MLQSGIYNSWNYPENPDSQILALKYLWQTQQRTAEKSLLIELVS